MEDKNDQGTESKSVMDCN